MLSVNDVAIQLQRSQRRTLSICINNGKVLVNAPMHMSEKIIYEFVEKKTSWIKNTLAKQAARPKYQHKNFSSGEIFKFLGQDYRLDFSETIKPTVLLNSTLQVFVGANGAMAGNKVWIHQQLQQWYMQQALEYLQIRTEYFSRLLKLKYKSIQVKYFKSRWGSCSIQGHIQYNYLIILAPTRIVDYIVVHELAHLKHHNHSADFWRLVASIVPDYKQCRTWLKDNGVFLAIN